MDMQQLTETLGKIGMPPQMRVRVIARCREMKTQEKEENRMEKRKCAGWRKPALAGLIAAAIMCVSVVGVAAVAGYFRDVKRADGAVVGTAYEQATEEIRAEAEVYDGALTVAVTLLRPGEPPYSECEQLRIGSYRITDMAGSVLAEGAGTDACPVSGGKVEIPIGLGELESGEYRLCIDQFIAEKKADQPLPISGQWVCDFRI